MEKLRIMMKIWSGDAVVISKKNEDDDKEITVFVGKNISRKFLKNSLASTLKMLI